MNTFDIIALVIFFAFVLICAWRGLLKIISKWAAFFAAMIIAKMLGAKVGFALFKNIPLAQYIGMVLLFVVLYIVCRLLFAQLSKAVNKILHTKTLDHILGGVVGVLGGSSVVFLFSFVLELVLVVISQFGFGDGLLHAFNSSKIFKFFFMF